MASVTTTTTRGGKPAPVWLLEGPASADLDAFVTQAIAFGLTIKPAPNGGYRLSGEAGSIADLCEVVIEAGDSFGLSPEVAPADRVDAYVIAQPERATRTITSASVDKVTVTRPPARDDYSHRSTVVVHGNLPAAHALIRSAVDHFLKVTCVGQDRFEVTGSVAVAIQWWAMAQGLTIDDAESALAPDMPEVKVDTFVDLTVDLNPKVAQA